MFDYMNRLRLYIETLKRFDAKQIAHLCAHRISHLLGLRLNLPTKYLRSNLSVHSFESGVLTFACQMDDQLHCRIHSKEHVFKNEVNWNIKSYGKLWNYQLQYLDFLLDPGLSIESKTKLLRSISASIMDKSLDMESYPVSMRMMYSLELLKIIDLRKETIICDAYKVQLSFLEKNLEKHLRANHLLQNYIGLCFGFATVGKLDKTQKYLGILNEELKEQIFGDGGHYERSLSYHCSILSNLLCLYVYLLPLGLAAESKTKLNGFCGMMLSWLNKMTDGNTCFPLFNDCIRWKYLEVKQLFEYAKNAKIEFRDLGLKESGFRKFKQDDICLFINAGNISPVYQPGHAHADMLSFVLNRNGKEIIVDPGISTYELPADRYIQKSTAYHNTVSLGEENQSEIWASFRMARAAKLSITEDRPGYLAAEVIWVQGHIHRRIFKIQDKELVVLDQFESKDKSKGLAVAKFHLDHSIKPLIDEKEFKAGLGAGIEMVFQRAERMECLPYKQSFNFNECRDAQCIVVYFCNTLETKINWKN